MCRCDVRFPAVRSAMYTSFASRMHRWWVVDLGFPGFPEVRPITWRVPLSSPHGQSFSYTGKNAFFLSGRCILLKCAYVSPRNST